MTTSQASPKISQRAAEEKLAELEAGHKAQLEATAQVNAQAVADAAMAAATQAASATQSEAAKQMEQMKMMKMPTTFSSMASGPTQGDFIIMVSALPAHSARARLKSVYVSHLLRRRQGFSEGDWERWVHPGGADQ